MNIRLYHHSDQEEVVRIWKTVFNYDSPHNDPLAAIKRKEKQKDNLFFVAEEDQKIIGTIMAGYDGHRGWIYSLAVAPESREKGIGTKLLRRAEEELMKLDCPKINLQVLPSNEGVTDFYKKNGYLIEERISMGKKLT